MSKSITVNECRFTPFANDLCQSLLKSTSMGSHPLLMVDVKSTTVNEYGFTPFSHGRCQVYYSQREYIATFAESICIYKVNECSPEHVLIIWVLTNYLLVNAQCIFSWDFNMHTLFQQKRSNKIIKNYIFNWLLINFLLCFILRWTIIHYYFVFCVWK